MLVRSKEPAQSQRAWIGSILRLENKMDSVGSQPGFIHHIGAEYVRFAQGQHLAMPLARVTVARKIGTLRRLSAEIIFGKRNSRAMCLYR